MKKLRIILVSISFLLLFTLFITAFLFSTQLRSEIVLEAGDHEITETMFLKRDMPGVTYKVLTDISSIDTHVPGETDVQILLNGKSKIYQSLPYSILAK